MSGPDGELAQPAGERTAQHELDDALYYLRTDCVPCAERHFARARLLGATEDAIAAVRAEGGGIADPPDN